MGEEDEGRQEETRGEKGGSDSKVEPVECSTIDRNRRKDAALEADAGGYGVHVERCELVARTVPVVVMLMCS